MRRYQLIPSHAVQTLIITTTSPITSGEVTLPYSFSFNAIGGTPPYTWSETGTLPTGFTLSSGGTLSGTPSATYANSFNVTVSDSIGSHYTASFNLTIVAAVSITTTSPLPNATESSSYSFTMAATGGFTPYTWSLLSSTGSNSWSVSPTGVVTGLPGSVEIDTLDIQVVDALGVPSAANFNLTVSSSSGQTFAFYIATTGSDSNVGSLASPWAITAINTKQSTYAGLRLGILPGTYDVSITLQNCNVEEAILQIQGGPNSSTRTYIGTSNAGGTYQQGTATIDCFGASGQYGGGNSLFPYPIGQTDGGGNAGPQPSNLGNWTLDGLIFSGYSRWAVALADAGGGPGQIPNATIQNCTFHNGRNPTLTTHPAPITAYRVSNLLISNCWLYDNNSPADKNHYAGILVFGISGPSTNVTIEKCTIINSANIYLAEDNSNVDNVTIRQCYFDMTLAGSGNFAPPYAIQGAGTEGRGGGGTTNNFHNNIVKGGNFYDMNGTTPTSIGVNFYNNTWDRDAGTGYSNSDAGLFRMLELSGLSGLFQAYNNLVYDNGAGAYGQYQAVAANIDGFTVLDYNVYGAATPGFYEFAASGGAAIGSASFASWKTATGADAHSIQSASNPFTNNGVNALAYQISPGSSAYQFGFTGGTSAGTVVNAGAWDGVVTQIGCSFADGRTT